jgi:uncharacterized protein YdhG (YjbR/CyaY superfamily)
VQFPLDKPFPFDLLKKIVLFRVQENINRKAKGFSRRKNHQI